MSDIGAWLESLGLGEYIEAFADNAVELDVVAELSDGDLEKIGVRLGHRKKLLKAIAAFEDQALASIPTHSRDAERRQLTVMFCDLVGSTELSERLDPEDLREVMRAYQDACAGAIGRFDGYIAQTLGDGLMVYFGYPMAHEDDAQRAVRAGLDIVGVIDALSTRLEAEQGVTVAVRVGVHTGLVVAGEVGGADTRGDMAVVGQTPNVAARIESAAEPGTVLVGERTRRLVGEVFDFDDLGPHDLKGLSAPMTLYRARDERAADSRFEAMHPAGLTPFVGRDEEVGLLLGRWGAAKDGEGQVVLLEGEPGFGKSRITNTLRELIVADDHTCLQYQCSPFYNNSAYYPIITHFERAARFQTDDASDTRLDKLQTLIGTKDSETLALIGGLLSLPTERYPALTMSPQKLKERTVEVLVELIAKLAAQTPILMVFEDLHWIDPSSLETLDQVIAAIEPWPVLLLLTFRPEFEPQWGAHTHVTAHSLIRLGKRQSALLVDRVTGDKTLPDTLKDQIVA
ncbi:MAG: adenylate/guanylate cyclase domain-containing protein, partial [Alphaproteobacteria bacterium]